MAILLLGDDPAARAAATAALRRAGAATTTPHHAGAAATTAPHHAGAAATTAPHHAGADRPGVPGIGRDVAILPTLGPGRAGVTLPAGTTLAGTTLAGAALVVMTGRPSVTQAACALLLGAEAYLPLELPPDRTADALRRVEAGGIHLEPETAAALHAVVRLTAGFVHHPQVDDVAMALTLRARGWEWPDAAGAAGVDPAETGRWLQRLLARIRQLS